MRRGLLPFLVLVLAFSVSSLVGAWAQPAPSKPHLSVFPFENATGLSSYDAACGSLSKSLALTVNGLGMYELDAKSGAAVKRDPDTLRSWAAVNSADFILFGRISQPAPGQVRCALSIYDRAKGTISISEESPSVGTLDVFDAADELIASVLRAVTGRHIGFGAIRFANEGAAGHYSVRVDGMEAGRDLVSLGSVPEGRHAVVIVQDRMLGSFEALRWEGQVAEGEVAELAFALPDITPEEKTRLDGLERAIAAGWDSREAVETESAQVREFLALSSAAPSTPATDAYRSRAKQLDGEWKIQANRLEILAAAREPDSGLLAPSILAFFGARSYPEPERIKAAVRENAELLAAFLELKAGACLAEGDYEGAALRLGSLLDFSGYLPARWRDEFAYGVTALNGAISKMGKDPEAASAEVEAVFGGIMDEGSRFAAQASTAASRNAQSLAFAGQGLRSFGRPVAAASVAASAATQPVAAPPEEVAKPPVAESPVASGVLGGRISLPWIPADAKVSIGDGNTKKDLPNEASEGYLSPELPVGAYSVAVGSVYQGKAMVSLGKTIEPEDYRAAMTARYDKEKEKLTRQMAKKPGLVKTGNILGLGGVVSTLAVYLAGTMAIESYQAAEDATSAESRWTAVETCMKILPATISVGGLGFGILLFSGPNPKTVQKSIDLIDSEIALLNAGRSE